MTDSDAPFFRHEAMATWFEVHLAEDDPDFARGAATEAFLLLDRLEGLLSRYREDSEVSVISRMKPGESFRVADDVFDCLALALTYSEATGGIFDPALGNETDRRRGVPVPEENTARGRLILDPEQQLVLCEGGAVRLDLGAIGKGFALDRMARFLEEWGVEHALLVSGGSSIRVLNAGDEIVSWPIGIGSQLYRLENGALGCSGTGVQGAHIFDPRTGRAAGESTRVWAVAETAAQADAFSTAFMVMLPQDIVRICEEQRIFGAARQKDEESKLEWLVKPSGYLAGPLALPGTSGERKSETR